MDTRAVARAFFQSIPIRAWRLNGLEVTRFPLAAIVTFELNGHVMDVEFPLQQWRHHRKYLVMIDRVGHHAMGRERNLASGQTPYVKVVHFFGSIHRE